MIYRGLVTQNADPENLLRVKAVVPQLLGEAETSWCWPVLANIADVPVPDVNSPVWITFEGGDTNKPVWLGVWQSNENTLAPLVGVPDTPAVLTYGDVTSQLTYGLSPSNGLQLSLSRSDHSHGTPPHTGAEHVAGVSVTTAPPGSLALSDTILEGTSPYLARADHRHGVFSTVPASAVTTGTFGAGDYAFPANVSTSGTSYADRFVNYPNDLDDAKLNLFSGTYTLGVRANTLAYFVPSGSAHRFYINNVETATIDVTGVSTIGTSYANRFVSYPDDLDDQKLNLWGGTYTLGVRANTLAYFVPGAAGHRFYVNNVETALIDATGVSTTGNVYANRFVSYPDDFDDQKVILWSNHSLGIREFTLGYFVPSGVGHRFYVNNAEKCTIDVSGITSGAHIALPHQSYLYLRNYGDTNHSLRVPPTNGTWGGSAGIIDGPVLSGWANVWLGTTAGGERWQIYVATGGVGIRDKISVGAAGDLSLTENIVTAGTGAGVFFRQRSRGVTEDTEGWVFYANVDSFFLYSMGALANRMAWKNVGGALEWKAFSMPTVSGTMLVYNTTSGQIAMTSSAAAYKTNITDLPAAEAANPLWRLRPRRFKWNAARVVNGSEENARIPGGFAGLIAEEVAAVAPEAVHVDADGNPVSLDTQVIQGYIVHALLQARQRIQGMETRLTALEGQTATHAADNIRHLTPTIPIP